MGATQLGEAQIPIRATTDKLDGDLNAARGKVQGVLEKLASGIGAAFSGITKIAAGIGLERAISGIVRSIGPLVEGAAQLQGVQRSFDGLAASAGIGADEMIAALQRGSAGMISQRDLMLSFNKAAQLISVDFAKQLPDAMQYLGKVAAATGQDMDFMMNSLVLGVGRLSPMILDNLGIQASLAEATARASTMFGVEAESLTKAQTQAGMMNVVLEKLAINTANMPEVAGTATAALAQLKAGTQDLGMQIGTMLLPAFATIVGALGDFVGWLQTATAEGGFLYPVLLNMGAAAGIVADSLSQLGGKAREAGQSVFSEFGGRVMATAEAAFTWGINIVTQLASGIIQGAVGALTAAMNFVASILAWFLSPGSPPRVAPDIDKWGMEAMNEYLHGFTAASFDILEGLQGPLSAVLSSLVASGDLGKEAAASVFRNISADLTYAVSEFQQSGTLYEGLLKRLGAVGGAFGDQLVELTKRQFALAGANERMAAATDRMREASERLVTAQDDQETAQTDLARITDEYNSMLLTGASYEELYAKRAEKEAASRRAQQTKDALKAAKDESKAATAEEKAAKKQLALDQERLDIQSRLVEQMLLLAKTQADMVAKAASGGGGGGGGGGGVTVPKIGGGGGGGAALELPEMPAIGAGIGGGITSGLEKALDDAKQRISDKFAELIKPFTDMLASPEIQTALDGLGRAWDGFSAGLKTAYDTWIQPIIDGFNKFIPAETRDKIIEDLGKVAGVFLVLGGAALIATGALSIASGIISALTTPIGLVILAIAGLAVIWETDFLGIRTFLETTWWPGIATIFQNVMTWIAEKIIIPIQTLRTQWETEVWPAIQRALENAWTVISTIFAEIDRWINVNIIPWVNELKRIWSDEVWPEIQKALEKAWKVIEPIWIEIKKWAEITLSVALFALKTTFETVMTGISVAIQPVKDLWDALVDAVKKFWDWISGKEFKFKINIPDLPDWATPGSPLPIHTAWKKFAQEMNAMTIRPHMDLGGELRAMMARPGAGGNGGTSIIIYGLTLEGVQDRAGLLAELQGMV